ncbi:hypothetical protein IMSAGC019_03539 [Lachnospiraceae bacterium]|nr:hypothetical protein IMSAGC019_03539 [Lachnospiraceae bacterium]
MVGLIGYVFLIGDRLPFHPASIFSPIFQASSKHRFFTCPLRNIPVLAGLPEGPGPSLAACQSIQLNGHIPALIPFPVNAIFTIQHGQMGGLVACAKECIVNKLQNLCQLLVVHIRPYKEIAVCRCSIGQRCGFPAVRLHARC